MQTFLSEPTFEASAAVLDSKRLNKQLLEGRQILAALAGETKGWVNHPATKMWRGYEAALGSYLAAVAEECDKRGIKTEANWNTILTIMDSQGWFAQEMVMPPWWDENGTEMDRIVYTHRTALYHKDPVHYWEYKMCAETIDNDPLRWVCCATRRQGKPCGYYWPSHVEER